MLGTLDSFDVMVVGEIVESKNESMDWWEKLRPATKIELYMQQLEKPPRKSVVSFANPKRP